MMALTEIDRPELTRNTPLVIPSRRPRKLEDVPPGLLETVKSRVALVLASRTFGIALRVAPFSRSNPACVAAGATTTFESSAVRWMAPRLRLPLAAAKSTDTVLRGRVPLIVPKTATSAAVPLGSPGLPDSPGNMPGVPLVQFPADSQAFDGAAVFQV